MALKTPILLLYNKKIVFFLQLALINKLLFFLPLLVDITGLELNFDHLNNVKTPCVVYQKTHLNEIHPLMPLKFSKWLPSSS